MRPQMLITLCMFARQRLGSVLGSELLSTLASVANSSRCSQTCARQPQCARASRRERRIPTRTMTLTCPPASTVTVLEGFPLNATGALDRGVSDSEFHL